MSWGKLRVGLLQGRGACCGCRPWGVLVHVDEVLGVGENTPCVVVLPLAKHMDLEEFQAVPHAP